VFNGRNGSIMVTPTPDWDAQLAWLIEEGVHEDLIDPRYSQPENLRERIMRTMQILETWVAGQDVEALFFAAQARHSPYGWVLPLERLADNPQLEARSWFVPYRTGEAEFKGPGAPMRFSATPWRMGPSTDAESDAQALLEEMGWSSAP
jgi:crotonobetainyl-CoA:carnitine CoA-transferase CaiB-like acyl-CoA transferase